MLLRYSTTSPFVRKVSVTAAELGLSGRITRKATNPWDPADDLPQDNPLGKVPALVLDDGRRLYDSAVICEYLDSLHDGEKLFPAEGGRRWRVLSLHALADGVLEAAVSRFVERTRRPAALFWSEWDTRQGEKIARALDEFERSSETLGEGLTIAQIAAACGLAYLDFRLPEEDWRTGRPGLANWFEDFSQRPSMRETVPQPG